MVDKKTQSCSISSSIRAKDVYLQLVFGKGFAWFRDNFGDVEYHNLEKKKEHKADMIRYVHLDRAAMTELVFAQSAAITLQEIGWLSVTYAKYF